MDKDNLIFSIDRYWFVDEWGFLFMLSLKGRVSTTQKEGLKWQRNLQLFT